MVKNGYCNDEANTYECNYDGGDCCKASVNSEYCSECQCHHQEMCAEGIHPFVQDGFCHDETNNAACNFDGGDCCGICVNTEHCTDCICNGEVSGGGVPNALVGDGFCNDETNNADCNYDGGDCCYAKINTDHCSECVCSTTTGIITSPGFPKLYDKSLELSWLIQVPSGQVVEINFISFNVDTDLISKDYGQSLKYQVWGTFSGIPDLCL